MRKTLEANKEIVRQADTKIVLAVKKLKEGVPSKEGLNFFYHVTGLFGQRLWYYGKTLKYKEKPDIDDQKCIGCRRCSELCPMHNIEIVDGKAVSHNQCTMCYRCFSHCPKKALTILGLGNIVNLRLITAYDTHNKPKAILYLKGSDLCTLQEEHGGRHMKRTP